MDPDPFNGLEEGDDGDAVDEDVHKHKKSGPISIFDGLLSSAVSPLSAVGAAPTTFFSA